MANPDPGSRSATRIGLILFGVYLAFYAGFVLLNAATPAAMEATPLAGLNLAVLYGLGLIVSAFVLAVLYGWLAGKAEEDADSRGEASP